MKKLYFSLFLLFAVLTFAGAGYVLFNHGEPNAGYACAPMALAIAFGTLYRSKKEK